MGITAMQNSQTHDTARLWAIRVQDPTFKDWDRFSDWLEEAPANLSAYETVLDADAWAAELLTHSPLAQPAGAAADEEADAADEAPNVVELRPRKRWFAYGGAIAAAVAGVASWSALNLNPVNEIITAPGEHRTVALADGSRVILNGGTRITINRDKPREIELAAGEALFDVKHDESNPFVVTVGRTRLLDAGTIFNVISDKGSLDVAVAHGAVIYEPGRKQIHLNAGEALSRSSADAQPVLRKASTSAIGTWQSGRLQYSDAPLDLVARDLGRNIGKAIHPAGGAARLRFTGTLAVEGPTEEVLARAGPLLGVTFAADGDAWRMTPTHGAPPY